MAQRSYHSLPLRYYYYYFNFFFANTYSSRDAVFSGLLHEKIISNIYICNRNREQRRDNVFLWSKPLMGGFFLKAFDYFGSNIDFFLLSPLPPHNFSPRCAGSNENHTHRVFKGTVVMIFSEGEKEKEMRLVALFCKACVHINIQTVFFKKPLLTFPSPKITNIFSLVYCY